MIELKNRYLKLNINMKTEIKKLNKNVFKVSESSLSVFRLLLVFI